MNHTLRQAKNKRKTEFVHTLKRIDLFGMPLPSFNIKGEEKTRTNCGAFLTMLLVSIVVLYASIKSVQLQSRSNPIISAFEQSSDWTAENPINFNERNMKVAFAFEGFRDKKMKADPRYVRWIIRIFGKKDGDSYEKIYPHHECTEQDYELFYPIT